MGTGVYRRRFRYVRSRRMRYAPVSVVAGTGAVTLSAFTVSGTAAIGPVATGAVTLSGFTVSGLGLTAVDGDGAVTLARFAVAGQENAVSGTGAVSLSGFTVAGSMATALTGTGALTLARFAVSGSDAPAAPRATKRVEFVLAVCRRKEF